MDVDDESSRDTYDSSQNDSGQSNKRKRVNKFQEKWKQEFTWVQYSSDKRVKCTSCSIEVDYSFAGKSALRKHAESKQHQKQTNTTYRDTSSAPQSQPPLNINDVASAEASIAYLFTKHNTGYNIMSDFVSVMKEVLPDSKIMESIKLQRTKTTKIIQNVLSPYSTQIHIETIKSNRIPYGIEVDLSNMQGNRKLLPIVIFYWFEKLNVFVLDIVETPHETAKDLYDQVLINIASYDYKALG